VLDQSLNRGGATLRFGVLEGASPPAMLLHGAGMDHSMFEGQAIALHEAGHRVVRCDLRGHGSSQLDTNVRFRAEDALEDLLALHDALGINTGVIVGHSLGGNLGQEFGRRHPDRVQGLVAVDAHGTLARSMHSSAAHSSWRPRCLPSSQPGDCLP
jgi:pimeloyl-ACP methyl ester carboxylesterase